MTVLLECKDITKEYGEIKVLDKVNLKIKNGEKIGIVKVQRAWFIGIGIM